jgi:hypothetical protein
MKELEKYFNLLDDLDKAHKFGLPYTQEEILQEVIIQENKVAKEINYTI